MSKKSFLFDSGNVELLNIDVWGIVTLPIRLLGRVAIDSGPGAQTYPPATKDVCEPEMPASRPG
jgi:hypothetical protein